MFSGNREQQLSRLAIDSVIQYEMKSRMQKLKIRLAFYS